jgi:hypothetical protein
MNFQKHYDIFIFTDIFLAETVTKEFYTAWFQNIFPIHFRWVSTNDTEQLHSVSSIILNNWDVCWNDDNKRYSLC